MYKGSGLFIKRWNGYKWEYKEIRPKKRVKFSWGSVGFLVCLVFGMFVGYLINR